MNIIISIHKPFCDQIFSGEKPLEFRNNLPKALSPGDKVFVYETYAFDGSKMVIGEFTIKNIFKIPENYRIGTYTYLDYYAKNILKDEDVVERIEKCKNIQVTGYYQDIVFNYLYLDNCLEYIKKFDKIPNSPILDKYFWAMREKANKLINDCDMWLIKIGFSNADGYCYPYGFEIENPIRYVSPIPITEFSLRNGNKLKKAPQSWCYTINT